MEIFDFPQGSPEWLQVRSGCITASMFSMVRAKVGLLDEKQQKYVDAILIDGRSEKGAMAIAGYAAPPKSQTVAKALRGEPIGEWSDKALDYAFRLAVERISGGPIVDDAFETFAMREGRRLEEDCRKRHELDINDVVDLASFIKTEDGKFGVSLDGTVGVDGIAEYKAFYASKMVKPILWQDDWGDIMDQGQGGLWITGRKWLDICLLFPPLAGIQKDFKRIRVLRDDNYIEKMEQDLIAFEAVVSECEHKLRTM